MNKYYVVEEGGTFREFAKSHEGLEDAIEFAKRAYGDDAGAKAKYCTVSGSMLPFASGSFDAVISNAVLYSCGHQRRHIEVMQDVIRVLRPGGCAWMAWNGACGSSDVLESDWKDVHLMGATFTTVNEVNCLGWTEMHCETAYSLIACKNIGS